MINFKTFICFFVFCVTKHVSSQTLMHNYDSQNRLIKSQTENAAIEYEYDNLGNRTKYVVNSESSEQTDLSLSNIHVLNTSLQPSGTSEVFIDIIVNGSEAVSGITLKAFLSGTSTGKEIEVGSISPSTLTAGNSTRVKFDITIPETAQAGEKFLVFQVDSENVIEESDEENNVVNTPIEINGKVSQNDLQLSNLSLLSSDVKAGEVMSVSVSIINNSIDVFNDVGFKCFLSLNPSLETYSDIELTTSQLNSLSSSSPTVHTFDISLPSNTISGNYYIIGFIDPENVIAEADEVNNIIYVPLAIIAIETEAPPAVSFIADKNSIGTGTKVQFTDQSTNNPTSWQWAFSGGTPSTSTSRNPVVTYSSEGVFDVGLTVSNSEGASSVTMNEKIIVSNESSEIWKWASSFDHGNDFTIDLNGNIFFTGTYTGSKEFATTTLTTDSYNTMFLGKMDKEYNLLWVKQFGDSSGDKCEGQNIVCDNEGNIYLSGNIGTGNYTSTINFNESISLPVSYNNQGDCFVAKFDNDGNVIWAQNIYSKEEPDRIADICVDNIGNCYITGTFRGGYSGWNTMYFPGGLNLTNEQNDSNVFIAKLSSSNGETLWVKQSEKYGSGYSYQEGHAIATDNETVSVIGSFSGTAIFSALHYDRTASGLSDIFVADFNAENGNISGLLTLGGDFSNASASNATWYYEEGCDIVYDSSGYKYICGKYSGNGNFVTEEHASKGYADIFICKLSSAPLWTITGGSNGYEDAATDLALDSEGNLYIAGYYGDGFSLNEQGLTGSGSFFAKLNSSGDLLSMSNCGNSYFEFGKIFKSELFAYDGTVYLGMPDLHINVEGKTEKVKTTLAQFAKVCPDISPALSISNDVICNEGRAIVSVNDNFYSYEWSNGQTGSSSIEIETDGGFYVNVFDDNGCKGTSDTVYIRKIETPEVTIHTDKSPSICHGDSVILSVEGNPDFQYSWLNNGSYILGATSDTLVVRKGGTYQIEISKDGFCPAISNRITVDVRSSETAIEIVSNKESICDGDIVELTASAINQGENPTYQWYINNQPIADNTATLKTDQLNNLDTVFCTLVSSEECASKEPATSNTIVISKYTLPIADIGSSRSICDGETAKLDAGEFMSYLWNNGSEKSVLTVSEEGVYSVTVTDNNGCKGISNKVSISVDESPSVKLGSNKQICKGESISLNAGYHSSYKWSNSSVSQTIIVAESGTYSVTVTNSSGCSKSDEIKVIVNDLPSVDLGADKVICTNQSVVFDAGDYDNYAWSNNSATNPLTVKNTGAYSVTVIDENGCQNSSNVVNITVSELPPINLGTDMQICKGDTAILDAGVFDNYSWSNGFSEQKLFTTEGGIYSVSVSDEYGCITESNNILVTVNDLPLVDLGGSKDICQGDSAVLDAGNFMSYKWSDGSSNRMLNVKESGLFDVTVADINGCLNSSSEITISVHAKPIAVWTEDVGICKGDSICLENKNSFFKKWDGIDFMEVSSISAEGIYSKVVTNEFDCQSETPKMKISVHSYPKVNIGPDTTICFGDTVLLKTDEQGVYIWNNGEGTNGNIITVAGSYSLTVTNTHGCHSSDTVTIKVNQLPQLQFEEEYEICEGDSIKLNAGNQYHCRWNTGAEGSCLIVKDAGSYHVEIKDSIGCIAESNETSVVVNSVPIADFDVQTELFKVTFENLSENADSYYWDFGDNQLSKEESPIHTYSENGEYFVQLNAFNEKCSAKSAKRSLTFSTTAISTVSKPVFSVYPNPASKRVTIAIENTPAGSYTLEIYNTSGQSVFTENFMCKSNKCKQSYDVSELTAGNYSVLVSSDNVFFRKPIVVK